MPCYMALCAQGRYEEALPSRKRRSGRASRTTSTHKVHWRRVRATILARRGEVEEAVRLATEAGGLVRSTDDLDKQGKTLMDLAEVLRVVGRTHEAVSVAREAVDAYERKGNVVMTEVVLRLLRELEALTQQLPSAHGRCAGQTERRPKERARNTKRLVRWCG